jgi:Flp pilus assembly protein TadG
MQRCMPPYALNDYNLPARCAGARSAAGGQVLVIFALFSMLLVGGLALSIDTGYLMAQRRGAQNAVDAAALAADVALQHHQFGSVQATGQGYAAANAFANGGSNTVTISSPPTSGPKAGNVACVEASVTHDVTRFFVGAVYSGPWQVAARAVACAEPEERPYAVMALNPAGSGITSGGSSYLAISDGGAYSAADVDICGTASWLQADGPLDAVSGLKICANATVDAESMNGAVPPTTDPLAGTSTPVCSGPVNGKVWPDPKIDNKTTTPIVLEPGNYPQGITIKTTPKSSSGVDNVITFKAGVYCFGNDLKATAGSSGWILKGANVLWYFNGVAMLNVDGGGNDVQITSGPGPNCDIDACNKRIVIFYGAGNCNTLTLVGGNHTHMDGIVYAPCSLAKLGGGSGSEITGQVLVGEVAINGGAHLTITHKQYVVTRIPLVYLVE